MNYDVKDMLEIAIWNNDYLWEVAVIDRLQGELDRLYSQEAKAKAFDEICKAHVPLEKRMSPVTIDEGLDFAEETEGIILKYYESGEPNEL